jgi:hypothetical protein
MNSNVSINSTNNSRRKIYLAGAMSNIPYFNFPEFFKYAELLRNQGYDVFSPAEQDIKTYGDFWKSCPLGTHEELIGKPGPIPTYREVLKVDLNYILDHADVIALIPGWEKSKGVKAELSLAECLGLEIMHLGN